MNIKLDKLTSTTSIKPFSILLLLLAYYSQIVPGIISSSLGQTAARPGAGGGIYSAQDRLRGGMRARED